MSQGIAILCTLARLPKLTYKVIGQSPVTQLEKYFGKTAQFPLATTVAVKKGDIVALTVPTWAPAPALHFGKGTSWRASRAKGECKAFGTPTRTDQSGCPPPVLLRFL